MEALWYVRPSIMNGISLVPYMVVQGTCYHINISKGHRMTKSFVAQKRPNVAFKAAHFGLKIPAEGGFIFSTTEIPGAIQINSLHVLDMSKLHEV